MLNVANDSGIRVLVTLDRLAPLALEIQDATSIEHVVVTSFAEYSAEAAAPPEIARFGVAWNVTYPISELRVVRPGKACG